MREVVIAGVGMTPFGKHLGSTLKTLSNQALREALDDSRAVTEDVQQVYFSNVLAGILQGQESSRGQYLLSGSGLDGVPLVNVENACTSGSTAIHQAWLSVASGHVEVALAIGVEKLYHPQRGLTLKAMTAALDQDRLPEIREMLDAHSPDRSIFMDVYADLARRYMAKTGATREDFALVCVKNHRHGLLNDKAQHGARLSVEEVLSARAIVGDLTLPMCAPIGDGAAAVILTTPERAARWKAHPVRLLASVLACGILGAEGELVPRAARLAYEAAGVGPGDVDVLECHDATSPAELIVLEELGLCENGEAPHLTRSGATALGGRLPVNPSGGLESKGHPLGATGIAQVVELADQLRGRCGDRQVEGARIALAENAGGYLGPDMASATVTVLGV